MFKTEFKLLPPRLGERYASALNTMNLNNKIYKKYGKISLKLYVENFIKKQNSKKNSFLIVFRTF